MSADRLITALSRSSRIARELGSSGPFRTTTFKTRPTYGA